MTAEPSFTCPRCGRTSHHPNDVREGYCGACHDWTGQPSRDGITLAVPGEPGGAGDLADALHRDVGG
jgi:hypothetical protein